MKLILTTLLFITPPLHSLAATDPTQTAIEAKSRSAEDKKSDEHRQPKKLLEFSKVKAGDTVVDFFPGKGYWTGLFTTLVGTKGKVIAHVPKEVEGAHFKPVESGKKAVEGKKNAELKVVPMTEAPGKNVDVVWTVQNYHDMHIPKFMKVDVAAYNKLVFQMLKPGGYYVVVDHVANPGADLFLIEKLHRIDPKQVRKEIEAAGFVFEEESKALAQNEDHNTNVFDPAIRGKTDQFAYRFVKPKK
jgi:predicted methyltransferase